MNHVEAGVLSIIKNISLAKIRTILLINIKKKLHLFLLPIVETPVLPIVKQFYQFSKLVYFEQKIGRKKSLPTKSLVNSNADIPQISINPRLPLKVCKADGGYVR